MSDFRIIPDPIIGAVVPRHRAAWWNVAVFLAAFAVFEGGIEHFASPFQGADKVARKFAYFAAHKDEYDMVFVGSSRVMNQLSPREFDAQMAAAGRPCRSFNLGFAGMFLPESSFLIDQVRALRPARLRGMIVELSSPAPRHDAGHRLTERDVYWHHLLPTALACIAVWTDPESKATPHERVAQTWLQATTFARCMVHLGYGPQWVDDLRKLRPWRNRAQVADREIIGPSEDGFSPLLHTLGQGQTHAAKTGGDPTDRLAFQSMVERLRAEETHPAVDSAASSSSFLRRKAREALRSLLTRQLSALSRAGIKPFPFVGPGTTREQIFHDLYADGTLPTLLAFNDPTAHADLYALDVRADRNHLNAAGADLLSRQLAQAVVAAGYPPGKHRGR